jgi:hypothetical protein
MAGAAEGSWAARPSTASVSSSVPDAPAGRLMMVSSSS